MRTIWEALSDQTRRDILVLLKKDSLTAGEIYTHFDITKPSLSHHLSILRQANLVSSKKQGQNVIYSLNLTAFNELVEFIRRLKN